MDTNKIYTKSEKGNQVLRKRAGTLDSQERLVLLYVCGKSTNESIIESLSSRMSITEIIHCFEALEAKGLIIDTKKSPESNTQHRSSDRLDAETKRIIEVEMLEYIGPMAKIICADVWKKTNELETAIRLLSSNLPSKENVEAFRLRVLQRLSE